MTTTKIEKCLALERYEERPQLLLFYMAPRNSLSAEDLINTEPGRIIRLGRKEIISTSQYHNAINWEWK